MYAIGKVHYNVRQTPETWCHRAYKAAVTMGIENPGDAYHQAMLEFESGDADSTRESVREKEIEARAELIRRKRKSNR